MHAVQQLYLRGQQAMDVQYQWRMLRMEFCLLHTLQFTICRWWTEGTMWFQWTDLSLEPFEHWCTVKSSSPLLCLGEIQ